MRLFWLDRGILFPVYPTVQKTNTVAKIMTFISTKPVGHTTTSTVKNGNYVTTLRLTCFDD